MDWHRTLNDLKEHWPWLSPLSGIAAWLIGRWRGWRPREWAFRRWRLEKALLICEDDNEDLRKRLEDCQQSIEGGRKAIDYAAYALKEIANAAEQVKAAAEGDPSTNFTGSRSGRSRSRKNSVVSRSQRKRGPLGIP